MATRVDRRWNAILGMSSDHAGIDRELGRLRAELYYALARIDDPRRVRDYIAALRIASLEWREANSR